MYSKKGLGDISLNAFPDYKGKCDSFMVEDAAADPPLSSGGGINFHRGRHFWFLRWWVLVSFRHSDRRMRWQIKSILRHEGALVVVLDLGDNEIIVVELQKWVNLPRTL